MIPLRPSLTCRLLPVLFSLTLLSACAPPPGAAPSGDVNAQLQLILQQQQQQAEQLQALQSQLEQMQQQVTGEAELSARIEGRGEPARALPEAALPPPAMTPAPAISATASQELTTLTASASSYLAAFTDLASGRYAAAEIGFQKFLDQFPDHQYTANARFWLADAQAAQGKLQLAETNLRQILSDPKGQAKAPAALQRLARIYRQQGLDSQADEILEQLRNSYPDSPEAQHINQSEPPQ